MKNDLTSLYNLRKNFVVVGLTGRLGSGCTTAAELLLNNSFAECNFPTPTLEAKPSNEQRKYKISYNFLKDNWQSFTLIRASDVITAFLLRKQPQEIKDFLIQKYSDKQPSIEEMMANIEPTFLKTSELANNLFVNNLDSEKWQLDEEKAFELFFREKTIEKFSLEWKNALLTLGITSGYHPYQCFGDNLRKTGNPLSDGEFDSSNCYIIAEVIRQLIKIVRKRSRKNARIVIDSIRNSMESRYFKERYSAFYLFAVNTEEEYRLTRQNRYYNYYQLKALDQEYTKNLSTEERFYKQDIQTCIQLADIYLHNPNDPITSGDAIKTLKQDLLRYIALILHPGLITPTPEERGMQIAYTAKYNSGCISRQVGAVVTDSSFSLKSIGWNNTAEGQTPCLLRSVDDLLQNSDNESFSEYEKSEKYRDLVRKTFSPNSINRSTMTGRNLSFCFKDGQNCMDNNKNQVHTRSLHAEENAMLQIAKYGGEGLKDGYLFTTASPCELCSKKAYQLGIKRIIYIDPYPGISDKQILKSGDIRHQPETKLFVGAVGRAYHQLFEPFMAYKDELEILLGYDYKRSFDDLRSEHDRDRYVKELEEQKRRIVAELKRIGT